MFAATHARGQHQIVAQQASISWTIPSPLFRKPFTANTRGHSSKSLVALHSKRGIGSSYQIPTSMELAEGLKLITAAMQEATNKQTEQLTNHMKMLARMTAANAQRVGEVSRQVKALTAALAVRNTNNNAQLPSHHSYLTATSPNSPTDCKAWQRKHSNRDYNGDALRVAQAVAGYLDDGQIVATNYIWKDVLHIPDRLDALVIGKLPGTKTRVLVLSDIRWSRDAKWETAVSLMFGNKWRVEDLQDVDPNDPAAVADAEALQAEQFVGRKIMVALGSTAFTEDARTFVSKEFADYRIKEGWFEVQLGGDVIVKHHMP